FHAVHIFDFIETFEEMARKMVNRWPTVSEINLEAEMMGLTLSIICKTMFGAEIEAQIPRIGQLMDTMLQAAEFQLQPPLPDWVPTPGHWRQRQAVNELRSLILEIIRERQAEMAAGIAIKPDLLHMLLSARDENGEGLSEVEILEECLTVFVAGHETTAVALSWLIALLLKKPSVLARLKKELSENLDDRPLTVEALKQVPYLKQVIKESLRLHSPAQGFGRRPLETIEVDGYRFEKGETLIFSIYALHRLSEYYPDPLMFDPERFAPDQEPPPRYAYIPFGAGSRTCIGNAFAMLEMQVIMATVLRAVDLVALSDYSFETKLKVTLRPRDEIRLRAVEIPVKKSTSERLTPQEGVTPAQAGMTPSYPRNC
ncbi:MAG: cytochrome P450, partial [Chloroflexota bacterium]